MSPTPSVIQGVDNLTLLSELKALAADALPTDNFDYGSERQVTAENLFFQRCVELFPVEFEEGSRFHNYCLKATPEEMIEEALKILAPKLGGDASLTS